MGKNYISVTIRILYAEQIFILIIFSLYYGIIYTKKLFIFVSSPVASNRITI